MDLLSTLLSIFEAANASGCCRRQPQDSCVNTSSEIHNRREPMVEQMFWPSSAGFRSTWPLKGGNISAAPVFHKCSREFVDLSLPTNKCWRRGMGLIRVPMCSTICPIASNMLISIGCSLRQHHRQPGLQRGADGISGRFAGWRNSRGCSDGGRRNRCCRCRCSCPLWGRCRRSQPHCSRPGLGAMYLDLC